MWPKWKALDKRRVVIYVATLGVAVPRGHPAIYGRDAARNLSSLPNFATFLMCSWSHPGNVG